MLIRAVVAGILAQCRREADTRSPEAERHSVGPPRGHTATGAAVIGVVATGAAVIGAVASGVAAELPQNVAAHLALRRFQSADHRRDDRIGIGYAIAWRRMLAARRR